MDTWILSWWFIGHNRSLNKQAQVYLKSKSVLKVLKRTNLHHKYTIILLKFKCIFGWNKSTIT